MPKQTPGGSAGFMEFRIQNVNGIQEATIRLERGKITELTGKNGAGKTSAMRALMRYLGDSKAPIEVYDGADVGSVEGPGPTMTVTERVRMRGSAELQMADRAGALVRLISGKGRKGDTERSREYIRALAELVDVPVDQEAIEILCAGFPDLQAWLSNLVRHGGAPDLFTAATVLKPEVDERALRLEESAGTLEGRADGQSDIIVRGLEKLRELGVEPLPDETPCNPVAAQSAVAAAGADFADVRARAAARKEALERQERIRQSLGPMPDAESAVAALHVADEMVLAAYQEVQRLEQLLATAKGAHQLAIAERQEKRREAERITTAAGEWAHQQAILDEVITGPDDDDVLQAELAVEEAKVEEERHRICADIRLARGEMEKLYGERQGVVHQAKTLRKVAQGLADRLGEILAGKGLNNITVQDGRLVWVNPATGEKLDWDTRMSSGQRVRAAFGLAAAQFDGVVFLPSNEENAFYLLLDEANRAEIEQIVAEMDLFVVTEVPGSGPLAVRQRGGQP